MEYGGGPEKDRDVCFVVGLYACSPRIRLASRISFWHDGKLAWRGWHTGWHRQTTRQGMPLLPLGDTVLAADWNRRSVL